MSILIIAYMKWFSFFPLFFAVSGFMRYDDARISFSLLSFASRFPAASICNSHIAILQIANFGLHIGQKSGKTFHLSADGYIHGDGDERERERKKLKKGKKGKETK